MTSETEPFAGRSAGTWVPHPWVTWVVSQQVEADEVEDLVVDVETDFPTKPPPIASRSAAARPAASHSIVPLLLQHRTPARLMEWDELSQF
ncbi:hypothetical protein GCM10010383_78340 [Streptomyces lomondensis]|uniref:Uncharacterized protein n=1 Tax=Streptomyces lomondensis TaxID=68229 RepID=A0ABQ2XXQ9_9ACTN|nr:hypothetical protein GCM10010383_78340 [Streptomyces lomondensis]